MQQTWKTGCDGRSRTLCFYVLAIVLGCSQLPATYAAAREKEGRRPAASQTESDGVAVGTNLVLATQDRVLDPSFTDSKTRAQYDVCVKQSAGETWAIQKCGDEELSWQDARLNKLYKQAKSRLAAPDSQQLIAAQRSWLKKTEVICRWDAKSDGQGQRLDAQSCRLNRTTNRADELERIAVPSK